MASVRVGVLRGGPSSEYDVSLKTGQAVLAHLPADKYQAIDIVITKDGTWHIGGVPVTLLQAVGQVDVFFNCLHGEYGEDGTVQHLLDGLMVRYTGSGALASTIGMQKALAKERLRREGIKMPTHELVTFGQDAAVRAKEIFHKIAPPWIVKPADRGSSRGVFKVKLVTDLPAVIEQVFDYSPNILVEEFIRGTEASCGVIENWRGENFYPFCPNGFCQADTEKIKRLAVAAHKTLDLRHYSVADFVVSPRGVYLLEINTLPKLHDQALLPKAAKMEGLSYPELLDHIITLALK